MSWDKRHYQSLAGLARVSLVYKDLSQTQTYVEEFFSHLENKTLFSANEPFRVNLACYHVVCTNQDSRAKAILDTAYDLLQERADKGLYHNQSNTSSFFLSIQSISA